MKSAPTPENIPSPQTLREALDLTGGFRPEHDITPELWDLYVKSMPCAVVWWEKSFPLTNEVHLRLRLYFEPINQLALVELPPWPSPNSQWSLLGFDDVVRILRDACGAGKCLKTSFAEVESAFVHFCVSCSTSRTADRVAPASPMDSTLELL
jgi:hypothetical protein